MSKGAKDVSVVMSVILIGLALIIMVCKMDFSKENNSIKEEPLPTEVTTSNYHFKLVRIEGNLYYDEYTGVIYYMYREQGGVSGITTVYNPDGSLQIYEREEE